MRLCWPQKTVGSAGHAVITNTFNPPRWILGSTVLLTAADFKHCMDLRRNSNSEGKYLKFNECP